MHILAFPDATLRKPTRVFVNITSYLSNDALRLSPWVSFINAKKKRDTRDY